jgi:site-specific DNA-methyltransferase (adenine-specific)
MLNDQRIKYINDFINAKECFPGISLGGGVCYFLWDRDYKGDCKIINTLNGETSVSNRSLNEYNIFIRNNQAIELIKKVIKKNKTNISDLVESRNPFGFPSSARGDQRASKGSIHLHSSKGVGYVSVNAVTQGQKYITKYKVMFSKVTSEHAGEPDKSGMFRVLSTVKILPPNNVCTDSYLITGPFDDESEAENFRNYLVSKFARFLLLQAVTSINLSKDKFMFIPKLDFTKEWTDKKLYKHFELTDTEINYIESLIKEYDTSTNTLEDE